MKKVHVFTSAAFNYIPKVRMLFESLRRHHPEFVLHLALADRMQAGVDLDSEPFDEITTIEQLSIPRVTGWAFCHRIVELATAIKPFMLQRLLEREDCAKVLYMDPDMVAFSRLDDILEALEDSSLVLTPHLTAPETCVEGVMDNEISCLKHGIYNLGFIGVKADGVGRAFAKWWGDRVYRFCRDDIKNGLFTDQRWIDLVPAFFEGVAISKSSRHNVATWNLRTRVFKGSMGSGYTVDGEPLGFYHFTGFDSGAHSAMADKNASGNASVRELIDWYQEAIGKLSHDPLARVPWAFATFSDGRPITAAQRIVFLTRPDLQACYADPFDAGGYPVWWHEQGKREYPKLFDSRTVEAELNRITHHLGAGYSPDMPSTHSDGDACPASPATVAGQVRAPFVVRGWRVFRREGIKGVVRRLR